MINRKKRSAKARTKTMDSSSRTDVVQSDVSKTVTQYGEEAVRALLDEFDVGPVERWAVQRPRTGDYWWVLLNRKAVPILEGPEKLHIDKNWYVKKGKRYAHTLIRPRPKGLQVDHKDGNKLNLCYSNLEVVHRKENMRRYFESAGKSARSGQQGVYLRDDGTFNVGSGRNSKRYKSFEEAKDEAIRRDQAKKEKYDRQYEQLLGFRPPEMIVTFGSGPLTEREIERLTEATTSYPPGSSVSQGEVNDWSAFD